MFELALENGTEDVLFDEAKTFLEVIRKDDELVKFMKHPKIVKEEKVKQERLSITEINELLADLEHQMYEAAKKLDFEHATILRDSIIELKAEYKIK